MIPSLTNAQPVILSNHLIEIEKLALDLSEQERAALAANLLESLRAFYPTKMKVLRKR